MTESQQQIEALRTVDLRVIVLDNRGQPAPGAKVLVRMTRHAFPFGVHVHPQTLETPPALDQPVWRCISAASLEPLTRWPDIAPAAQQHDLAAVDRAIEWARSAGIQRIRWGTVLSFDAQSIPPWLALLQAIDELGHIESHVRTALAYAGRVDEFDLLGGPGDQAYLVKRFGPGFRRQLLQRVQAMVPDATVCLQYDDALSGQQLQALMRSVTENREAMAPFDSVAISARFNGMLVSAPITRSLEWLAPLGKPIVVSSLEVSGPSPAAGAINLETVLRVLFASPIVTGVYLTGVTAEHVGDPAAALLNEAGHPTPAGAAFDGLVHGLWWTDQERVADELGAVRIEKAFAGWYNLSAVLPDGSLADTKIYLPPPPSPTQRHAIDVILQPIALSQDAAP